MRHSVGIRVWCGKVCNLHGMVGFGERSIRWVLAFWVAGFGRSETDKRRFLPSFSLAQTGLAAGECDLDGQGTCVMAAVCRLSSGWHT